MSVKETKDAIDKLLGDNSLDVKPIHDNALDDFFSTMDEKNLVEQAQGALNEYHSMLKKKILEEDRIDLLAEEVLGYVIENHHDDIITSQQALQVDKKQMTLAFRGAGKSTIGCIVRAIYEILKNPNIRILMGSHTAAQAEDFLREVKEHFENNETFIAVFGNWVGDKWTNSEIVVNARTRVRREATITTRGVGSGLAGKHFDLIIGDDLAHETNSRTHVQRERVITWFYKTMMPTLDPGGRLFINGTRWHPHDLYGYLITNDPTITVLIIPLLTEDGQSAWPEKFPIDNVLAMRQEYGLPVFETQYQMNTNAMEGKVFNYDAFHFYEELPSELVHFGGVDLAISMKDKSDYFAFCTIGVDLTTNKKYVVAIYRGRLRFQQQTDYIIKEYFKFDHIKIGIESNAYQAAQLYTVQDQIGKNRAIPVYTLKDKKTRGMKLAAKCENEEVYFHKSQMQLIEECMALPDGDNDDLFDALEIAYSTATTGIRKKRRVEPGVM